MIRELRVGVGDFVVIGKLVMVLEGIEGGRPKFSVMRADGLVPWQCHDVGAILATDPDVAAALDQLCPSASKGVLLTSMRPAV